jgi:TolA-binding protein
MGLLTRSLTKGGSPLPFIVFGLVWAVGLSVSGCADLMAEDSLQQDVAQLRQDVNKVMLDSQRGRSEAETLSQMERRSREQANESSRQMAALSTRVESLKAELARVSGRLDQVSQRLENLGRQVQVGRAPAPRIESPAPPAPRIESPPPPAPKIESPPPPAPAISRALPTAPAAPPPTAPAAPPSPAVPRAEPSPSTTAPPSTARPSAPTAEPSPEQRYQAAYLDFSKGHYTLAIPAFRDFVRRFPDSALADSAQYAIGESYFSMARASGAAGQAEKSRQELEQAVQEFRKVILNYPRGSKVPSALYKEALALTELKQPALAQARLQYLLEHFPQSEEAPLAKERLAALKQ